MSDNLSKATAVIAGRVSQKPAFGHTVKIVLADTGTIFMDGTGNVNAVTNKNQEADLTLETSLDVMQSMDRGEMDAFSAYMQGKLSIKGDQSIAIAFGTLIGS